jgi:putative ABC transport system substrate-binding protein
VVRAAGGDGTEAILRINTVRSVYTAASSKTKRGDLEVQQGRRVELIINVKCAKALVLSVPLTLLGRADEVIE